MLQFFIVVSQYCTLLLISDMAFNWITQKQILLLQCWWTIPIIQPAESARAVTGKQCPHSGVGADFLACRPVFFMETTLTRKRKVEKSIPRCEMDCLSEGYRRPLTKFGVVWQNTDFWAENRVFGLKKDSSLNFNHVLATTGKNCINKKYPFPKYISAF